MLNPRGSPVSWSLGPLPTGIEQVVLFKTSLDSSLSLLYPKLLLYKTTFLPAGSDRERLFSRSGTEEG